MSLCTSCTLSLSPCIGSSTAAISRHQRLRHADGRLCCCPAHGRSLSVEEELSRLRLMPPVHVSFLIAAWHFDICNYIPVYIVDDPACSYLRANSIAYKVPTSTLDSCETHALKLTDAQTLAHTNSSSWASFHASRTYECSQLLVGPEPALTAQ